MSTDLTPHDALHRDLVRWGLAAFFACAGYLSAVIFERPVFLYFPMIGEWHWAVPLTTPAEALGPPIAFYGWKALGVLCALGAWLMPARWLLRLPACTGFVAVCLSIAAMLLYEARGLFAL
jgi:hypothetical protein